MRIMFKWQSALITAALALCCSAAAAAQGADCDAIYKAFYDERAVTDLAKLKAEAARGREYLEKCSGDATSEKYLGYVKKQVAKFNTAIKAAELAALAEKFNVVGRADDRSEMVSLGKELIAREHPSSLDIALMIATVSYNEVVAGKSAGGYRDDAVKYASMALNKLGSGAKSEDFGIFKYAYKTPECKNGAENATGWMNYILGYDLAKQDKKAEALPYYYKATQVGCETKNMGAIYRFISTWYLDKAKVLETQINEKFLAAGNKQTDETKALEAAQDVYLDRALDAMGRAYKALSAAKAASTDAVYKQMKDIYGTRYHDNMAGFDDFVAKIGQTPLPDPMTEVKAPAVTQVKPQMN